MSREKHYYNNSPKIQNIRCKDPTQENIFLGIDIKIEMEYNITVLIK